MSQDMNWETTDPGTTDVNTAGHWEIEQPRPRGNGCLKGCLIVAALLLIAAVISAWFVSQNWRGWAGMMVRGALEQALDDTSLPDEEKVQIQEQVDRVVTAFEEGQLTEAQVELLVNELAESPLAASVVAYSIEKKYFDSSGLSDEEKEAGRNTLKRCVRGWLDEKLTEEDADPVLSHIGTKDDAGNWELRDQVSDEELRAFLAAAKELADSAEIPETVEEVDPSDEIKRIVDAALNPEAADISAEAETEGQPDAKPEDPAEPTAEAEAEMDAEAVDVPPAAEQADESPSGESLSAEDSDSPPPPAENPAPPTE